MGSAILAPDRLGSWWRRQDICILLARGCDRRDCDTCIVGMLDNEAEYQKCSGTRSGKLRVVVVVVVAANAYASSAEECPKTYALRSPKAKF